MKAGTKAAAAEEVRKTHKISEEDPPLGAQSEEKARLSKGEAKYGQQKGVTHPFARHEHLCEVLGARRVEQARRSRGFLAGALGGSAGACRGVRVAFRVLRAVALVSGFCRACVTLTSRAVF